MAKVWLSRLAHRRQRGARHSVNAVLNLAYCIVAGRLGAHLAARGACLAIGFADKRSRHSVAWYAIEPLRSLIDARASRFSKRTNSAAATLSGCRIWGAVVDP